MTSTLIIAALNVVVLALTARQRFGAMRPRGNYDYMLERWFVIVMATIIVAAIALFIFGRIQRRQNK
jgi:membrane protein DedA with SNARE-associated domain